jgi:hypothetical protein
MPRRFCFGSIALPAFVLLKPCLCNEQTTIEKLADGIGKVDVCLALEEVIDGERDRQRRGDLVGRSKGGAHITTSIPGHQRMIFEIQQEPFFHLATEGLPGGPDIPCFEARNPARDALSSNFEQVDATHANLRHGRTSLFGNAKNHLTNFQLLLERIPEGELIWKPTIGS